MASYPEPAALADTAAFHNLFKCPNLDTPTIPDDKRCALRVSLIQEELNELSEAIKQKDVVEVADALADIQYVLSGAVHEFGMGKCFKDLFDEVHRSNMSKACTSVEEAEATMKHYRETKGTDCFYEEAAPGQYLVYRNPDRKALKSINYSPTSLAPILDQHKENQAPSQ